VFRIFGQKFDFCYFIVMTSYGIYTKNKLKSVMVASMIGESQISGSPPLIGLFNSLNKFSLSFVLFFIF